MMCVRYRPDSPWSPSPFCLMMCVRYRPDSPWSPSLFWLMMCVWYRPDSPWSPSLFWLIMCMIQTWQSMESILVLIDDVCGRYRPDSPWSPSWFWLMMCGRYRPDSPWSPSLFWLMMCVGDTDLTVHGAHPRFDWLCVCEIQTWQSMKPIPVLTDDVCGRYRPDSPWSPSWFWLMICVWDTDLTVHGAHPRSDWWCVCEIQTWQSMEPIPVLTDDLCGRYRPDSPWSPSLFWLMMCVRYRPDSP